MISLPGIILYNSQNMTERFPYELPPVTLDCTREIHWPGIFHLAIQSEGMYQEIRVYDAANEKILISFFEIAYTVGDAVYLHFQEFNLERERLKIRKMFKQDVEDIYPRGFRVKAKDRKIITSGRS
jgi:hypothetical protein